MALAQAGVSAALPAGPLRDLLVDGVIAGVGNVIVFVPQIALLFLFIGVMEDAGYLARVAFVIDRVMGAVGLHGKSFVPMLSGFSCAVPAVMATRTLENRTDRLLTMMVLPLMSCSARLPIYVLVIATVFGPAAARRRRRQRRRRRAVCDVRAVGGRRPDGGRGAPPDRAPRAQADAAARAAARTAGRSRGVLARATWRQVRSFLVDAGTIILALTIVMWALLNYPKPATRTPTSARRCARASPGASGHLMEPALAPLGLDWRVGIGILGAFSAREVFVSTLGIVFDISDADETNQPLREKLGAAARADGTRLFTPASGVALMVFFVLACQCMSTVAVVRRESGSWRWPLFMFGYQTVLAYVSALVVYQVGRGAGIRGVMAMGWQDLAVALIVCGAVAFLLRRVIGRRRRKAAAQSFVPLSSLKKRNAGSRDDGPACH